MGKYDNFFEKMSDKERFGIIDKIRLRHILTSDEVVTFNNAGKVTAIST